MAKLSDAWTETDGDFCPARAVALLAAVAFFGFVGWGCWQTKAPPDLGNFILDCTRLCGFLTLVYGGKAVQEWFTSSPRGAGQ